MFVRINPYTSKISHGAQATQGNRYVNIYRPVCGKTQNAQGKGGTERRRIGRKDGNQSSDTFSLGRRNNVATGFCIANSRKSNWGKDCCSLAERGLKRIFNKIANMRLFILTRCRKYAILLLSTVDATFTRKITKPTTCPLSVDN